MGIFRRWKKTQEPEGEVIIASFSPLMLAKRLVWDIAPCRSVQDLIPLMGMVPDSADVAEMEHQASHARLELLLPVKDVLDVLVPLVSGITASAMLVNSGIPADEDMAIELQRHHSQVVRASVSAVLANLLDMGVVTYMNGAQIGE